MERKRLASMAALAILLALACYAGACSSQQSTPVQPTSPPSVEPAVQPTTYQPAELGLSPTLQPTLPATTTLVPPPASGAAANPIVAENQKPGTAGWRPAANFGNRDQYSHIAGFADAVSVNLGGTLHLMVSTRTAGITYTLAIYRLGWYNGDGAREMLKVPGLKGQAQGYWDPWRRGIADCPTCEIDAKTGLIDTHWKSSYTLDVPQDWVSGEYLAKLTDAQGHEAYIQFIVRDDARWSDLLVQIAVNTYQAYNNWGGNSLYGPNSDTPYAKDRAVKVSFNRPIGRRDRRLDPGFIERDIHIIRFLEKNGYDLSYTTSVDIDDNLAALRNHRAFISVGHDEYWTWGMRDAVEKARDAGLNLAFLGGNDVYYQARYESDREGHPRRVLVVYRFANQDPMAATDPSRTAVRWDSPPVNRPQNSLTGVVYGGESTTGLVPWVVASTAPEKLLADTGLKPGDKVAHLVGSECDTAVNNGHQPPNLVIVAASPMNNFGKRPVTCNSTWYQAKGGAFVFAAGTTDWAGGLDDFGEKAPVTADPRLMKFMQNVLAAFGAQPAGPSSP